MLKSAIVVGVAMATMASMAVTAGTAGAGSSGSNGSNEDAYIIMNIEVPGESPLAVPQYGDGALLGVKTAEKNGHNVKYERIPAGAIDASKAEQAFLESAAKNPDVVIGLSSSAVFIPVGPKVAASGQPTIALASPSEGVLDGSAGGENIFLVRPLNEQTYSNLLQFICTDLKKELGEKEMKIALNLVSGAFGDVVQGVVDREIDDYKNCEVVASTSNSPVASDLTQQVLAIKDSDANVILSANYPNPSGVLVNQLRQNGVDIPFVGGASLNLAVDADSIQSLDNLWASDDCVPELEKTKTAKKFVKAYEKEYGYTPNYASAQVHDIINMVAQVVDENGHDQEAMVEALANMDYDGVCRFKTDDNHVMGTSVTVYKYKGATDKTKVLEKKYEVQELSESEIGVATTTTVAAG